MENISLKEHDEIYIGSGLLKIRAVISSACRSNEGVYEVVYLGSSNKYIAEEVCWKNGSWGFLISGPCGTYAENSERLAPYVNQLKFSKTIKT